MNNFYVNNISEGGMQKLKIEWQQLVLSSDANKLFMGWDWQSLWWNQWGEKRDYKLFLLGAYNNKNELVGLAPLYKRDNKLFNFYSITTVQFIGSSWGEKGTVRSEYLDFIIQSDIHKIVATLFIEYISEDDGWDSFIL